MDWQPIETAPKDGTWIIVRSSESGVDYDPEVVCYHDGLWMEARHYLAGCVDYEGWALTHWMRLPEPPEPAPIIADDYPDGVG